DDAIRHLSKASDPGSEDRSPGYWNFPKNWDVRDKAWLVLKECQRSFLLPSQLVLFGQKVRQPKSYRQARDQQDRAGNVSHAHQCLRREFAVPPGDQKAQEQKPEEAAN